MQDHSVYTIPGGASPGAPGKSTELPDNGRGHDGAAHCQRVPAGRSHSCC